MLILKSLSKKPKVLDTSICFFTVSQERCNGEIGKSSSPFLNDKKLYIQHGSSYCEHTEQEYNGVNINWALVHVQIC